MIDPDKVSIIIPVYNGEKYLRECIDSCLSQTYRNFQIILVNDGSTDNSMKIIDEYYALYPERIAVINKTNGGTASALNRGIMIMNGEWVKWLSCDDCLHSNALELFMMFICETPKPINKIFYTDYEIIDGNSKHVTFFKEPKRSNDNKKQCVEMLNNFFGNGTTSFMHRDLFKMVGEFDETLPYNEDYEYWLRAIFEHGIEMKHLEFFSAQYRIHDDSLTSTKDVIENRTITEKLRENYYTQLDDEQRQYLKSLKTPVKKIISSKLPAPLLKLLLRLKIR